MSYSEKDNLVKAPRKFKTRYGRAWEDWYKFQKSQGDHSSNPPSRIGMDFVVWFAAREVRRNLGKKR
jgi:hypothetical protein